MRIFLSGFVFWNPLNLIPDNTGNFKHLAVFNGAARQLVRDILRGRVFFCRTDTIHLFYDVAIDRADIAGALKRLAARLRKPPEL